jgi:hypothetical protein
MKFLIPVVLITLPLWLTACSDEAPPQGAPALDPGNTLSEEELAIGTPISALQTQPAQEAADTAPSLPAGVTEIEWDSLIPEDYRPEKILEKFDIDNLSDDDPRADELQKELQALWDQAPVRPEMDGQSVKIPGFVVPVETDAEETTGFLLVPYYGACIHVPPPPANQTIYVVTEKGKGTRPKTFDVVWVSGDMSVQRIENDVAEAGYTLYANEVTPYE